MIDKVAVLVEAGDGDGGKGCTISFSHHTLCGGVPMSQL